MFKKSSIISSFLSLIFILIAFFGVIFYVKPVYGEVSDLSAKVDKNVSLKEELQNKVNELKKLKDDLSLASDVSQNTVLSAIPIHFDEEGLLNLFSDLAIKNGMVLNGITFGISDSNVKEGVVTKSSVNVNLVGDKSELVSFLKGIEGSPRKIVIKSITVQNGEGEMSSQVSFSLNMEVFYQGLI